LCLQHQQSANVTDIQYAQMNGLYILFPSTIAETKRKSRPSNSISRFPSSYQMSRGRGKGENLPYNELEQGVANVLLLHVHSVFQLELKYNWITLIK